MHRARMGLHLLMEAMQEHRAVTTAMQIAVMVVLLVSDVLLGPVHARRSIKA